MKCLLIIISSLLLATCGSQTQPVKTNSRYELTSVDDLGREVRLNHPPQRIVSLDPSVTEILFALGLDKEIVGVTTYCDYPERAKSKAKVGGYLDPNIEVITLLQPELLVTTLKTDTLILIRKLEEFGIKIFVLDPKGIQDIFKNISSLAKITHREEEGKKLMAEMKRKLYEVKRKVAGTYRPRVFVEMGADPLISVGPGSFTNDLIEIAGGRNIAQKSSPRYRRYTLEEVLLADAEVIIICSMNPDDACLAQKTWWQRWKNIPAVQNNRIYIVSANLVTRPSPRIIEGLIEIAEAIHPEIFLER